MARLLTIFTIVFALILFPPAVLAYVSQNAVPGDRLYPVKRKLEDIILAVASINPITKAYFSTSQSAIRFREAATLISKGVSSKASLGELVTQTNVAVSEIQKVENSEVRAQLVHKLSSQIESYNQELKEANTKENAKDNPSSTQPTNPPAVDSPTPAPARTNPLPTPTQAPINPVPPPVVILQTPPPQAVIPAPSNPPPPQGTQNDISKTIKELEKIKEQLEAQKHKEEKKNEPARVDEKRQIKEEINQNLKIEDKKESKKESGDSGNKIDSTKNSNKSTH